MEKAARKQQELDWVKRKEANRFHNLALLGIKHLPLKTLLRLINRKAIKFK